MPPPLEPSRVNKPTPALPVSRSASATAPLAFLALMLVGYGLAHVDDGDALLYRRFAEHLLEGGDAFRLWWTQTNLVDFHDHLPPPFWLLSGLQRLVGEAGLGPVHLAMTLGTWWLVWRMARRAGESETMRAGLWLLPFTDAYMRVQGEPRLDQPFLLMIVFAVAGAGLSFAPGVVVSALAFGAALLWRPPFALALLVVLPAARWALTGRLRGALGFVAVAAALGALAPLGLHVAAVRAGHPDLWQRYFTGQVLASLTGTRSDGGSSHLAPLMGLWRTFWPALPFALAGVWRFVRRASERTPWAWMNVVWAASVVVGLSLGRRHLPSHTWMAYPALFFFGGRGLFSFTTWLEAFQPGVPRVLPRVVLATGVVFAVAFPLASGRGRCDVLAAGARLSQSPWRERTLCPRVAVLGGEKPEWMLAQTVVDHWRLDVDLVEPSGLVPSPGCWRLVAARPIHRPDVGEVVHAGKHDVVVALPPAP
ncbi:MAG: hypothetical protein RL199_1263 [Pseudomonadota bacterium]|jgi:hypothetical protein